MINTAEVEVVSKEEVRELETDLANIKGRTQTLIVKDEESYAQGAEIFNWCNLGIKKCEDRRTFFVKPLNDHVSRINLFFKNYSVPFKELKDNIESKMLAWRRTENERIRLEEERIKKEQEKLQRKAEKQAEKRGQEAPPPLPIVLPIEQKKTVFNDLGSVTAKKNWTWEVVNANQVPREFLCIDEKKINGLVRAGMREIKGIKIWQEESLSGRA